MPWSFNQQVSRDWSSRHHGQHPRPTWGQEQGTSTPLPESTQQCSEQRPPCPLPVAGIKSAQLLPPAQTYLNPGSFATVTAEGDISVIMRRVHASQASSVQLSNNLTDILSRKCLVFPTDPNAVGCPCHLPVRTSHLIRDSGNAPQMASSPIAATQHHPPRGF